jgi:hypothetical protein
VGLGLSALLAPGGYAHVHQVLWAKLRFLGRLPADPEALSFDARLLWQGPFVTLDPEVFLAAGWWPLAAAVVLAALTLARAREATGYERLVLGLALVALPVAWLFSRLVVLLGLLVPVCAALALARWQRRTLALSLFAGLALAQTIAFAGFVGGHRIEWYPAKAARDELAALIEFVRANVPADEAIAADFVNSTALLAHTRHPIVLHPKYETELSRREAEAFLTTFFQDTPQAFARLLSEHFRCRHVLVDRHVLWDLSRWTAGLRLAERAPRAGTAAEVLLGEDPEALRRVEGFELLYQSPPGIDGADYRLFRLK